MCINNVLNILFCFIFEVWPEETSNFSPSVPQFKINISTLSLPKIDRNIFKSDANLHTMVFLGVYFPAKKSCFELEGCLKVSQGNALCCCASKGILWVAHEHSYATTRGSLHKMLSTNNSRRVLRTKITPLESGR